MIGIEKMLPMLASAMGLDSDEIMRRANDLELFARTGAIKIVQEQAKITEALTAILAEQRNQAERLSLIESMLITVLTKVERNSDVVVPAGDTWENSDESQNLVLVGRK